MSHSIDIWVRYVLYGLGLMYLITESGIFSWLRMALWRAAPFFGLLVYCKACSGFWIGTAIGLAGFSPFPHTVFDAISGSGFFTMLLGVVFGLMWPSESNAWMREQAGVRVQVHGPIDDDDEIPPQDPALDDEISRATLRQLEELADRHVAALLRCFAELKRRPANRGDEIAAFLTNQLVLLTGSIVVRDRAEYEALQERRVAEAARAAHAELEDRCWLSTLAIAAGYGCARPTCSNCGGRNGPAAHIVTERGASLFHLDREAVSKANGEGASALSPSRSRESVGDDRAGGEEGGRRPPQHSDDGVVEEGK